MLWFKRLLKPVFDAMRLSGPEVYAATEETWKAIVIQIEDQTAKKCVCKETPYGFGRGWSDGKEGFFPIGPTGNQCGHNDYNADQAPAD